MNKTFLIEVGIEELPPKSLRTIAETFQSNMVHSLIKNNIKYKTILWFATPRRIAIKIEKLNTNITKIKKYKGPSITNAFNHLGYPTKSTQCWIKKLGITINQVSRIKEKNKEWLYYECSVDNSQTIEKKLIEMSIFSITHISVSNSMKWNTENIQFSRPIRNIVMLLDNKLIKDKILGIKTNRLLFRHTLIQENIIRLSHAHEYPTILLKSGKIIADYTIRKNKIQVESENIVNTIGGYLKIRNILLEEITSLVEWPVVLLANFNETFLSLPNELLIHIIENQQKHFAIYDQNSHKLTNNFVIISNIDSKCPKNIILGNVRVLNSKFSDAKFFFKKDQKIPFNNYRSLLKNVIFQTSLGSIFEKTNRIKELVTWITQFTHADIKDCIRAANLCKCDLMTDMVFEFPEMQGYIGMYYALHHGESKNVAKAIKEHYLPRTSQDIVPLNPVSYSLALADKIDTLVGLFTIGKNSTSGDKDPFSLRRLAIAIIRIILTNKLSIDLFKLLNQSLNIYNNIENKTLILKSLKKFILDKIYFIYIKQKHIPSVIKSVLTCNITQLLDIDARIKAISDIYHSDALKLLILTHKRISSILILSNEVLYEEIKYELIKKQEEKIIISLLESIQNKIQVLFVKKEYKLILLELYNLYKPVCDFFNNIKIQDKNYSIKINRLTMLKKIQNLFLNVANFSILY
ncbi:MAG: glycine--tRNA ligase subunit beta [Buchnera aphidicola (Melaphis rhois)]